MAEHQHDQKHGKKLGDVPGNQTPGTPNRKESEGERGGEHGHGGDRGHERPGHERERSDKR
jgi:hypothetical protein